MHYDNRNVIKKSIHCRKHIIPCTVIWYQPLLGSSELQRHGFHLIFKLKNKLIKYCFYYILKHKRAWQHMNTALSKTDRIIKFRIQNQISKSMKVGMDKVDYTPILVQQTTVHAASLEFALLACYKYSIFHRKFR